MQISTINCVNHSASALPKLGCIAILASSYLLSCKAVAEPCAELQGEAGAPPISIHCGNTPSAVADDNGRLWFVFEQNGQAWLTYSDDLGANFSAPVAVNATAEDIEHNGEGRPKLQIADDGTLLVSWTLRTSRNFTGDIRFTRSTNGGVDFEAVRTINDDGLLTGHRFDELYMARDGSLYLSWIDKRDMEAAVEQGRPYPGAAVYYAVSTDNGATFSDNYHVSANSCECCRIAAAPYGESGIALFFRQIYGENTRDHAVALLDADGNIPYLQRASVDDWHIDACPHHGPAMLEAEEEGSYHLSWFSGGTRQQGLLYGLHNLSSGNTTQIRQIDGNPGAGHPALEQHGGTLYLLWKGFADGATQLQLRTSTDQGKSWSKPRTVLSTVQASDHPQLLTTPEGVFLAWSSSEYGYVFQELSDVL